MTTLGGGAFLVGLLMGSFVNVIVDRVPRRRSVLVGRSRCEQCGRALGVLELMPVLSYLFLRGRCRTCHRPIGWRTPVVEVATGLLFLAAVTLRGATLDGLRLAAYGALLLAIFFIDLEHRIVPNRLIYPAIAVRLADVLILQPQAAMDYLAGGALGLLAFLIPLLVYPGGMGMGDAKLAAFIGLLLGLVRTVAAVWISFVLGGAVAALLLLTGRKGRKDAIPFAPYLVSAALVVAFSRPQAWTGWLGGWLR